MTAARERSRISAVFDESDKLGGKADMAVRIQQCRDVRAS